MRFNPSTPWWRNYSARFGSMSSSQHDSIELALSDSLNAGPDEINQAVAGLCSSWSLDSRPTINDIADRIRDLRGEKKSVPSLVRYRIAGKTGTTRMIDLKRLLDARPDPKEARNIICTPLRTDQCRELERHCDERGIAYERFITPKVNYDSIASGKKAVYA